MKAGDIVKYARAAPGEEDHLFVVAEVREDDDGCWVLLEEEDQSAPDKEIAPGILGGFGCWEAEHEFEKVGRYIVFGANEEWG